VETVICFGFHKTGWWFWLILLATGVGAFVWEGKKAKERSNLKNKKSRIIYRLIFSLNKIKIIS